MKKLHFYYDIVCPFAYLASTGVEALAERAGAEVVWGAGSFWGDLSVHRRRPKPKRCDESQQGTPEYPRHAAYRDGAWSRVQPTPQHPLRTVNAMRLVLAASEADRAAITKRLFHAYHVDNQDISSLQFLSEVAAEFNVDMTKLQDPAIKLELRERARQPPRGVLVYRPIA